MIIAGSLAIGQSAQFGYFDVEAVRDRLVAHGWPPWRVSAIAEALRANIYPSEEAMRAARRRHRFIRYKLAGTIIRLLGRMGALRSAPAHAH